MHELKEARTELAELGEEAASAIRSETPLRSKFASWLLLCQTAMFLTVGLAFVGAGAAALSTAETFLSFHSDESLATALRAGLQMGIATGVFLVVLAAIGCVATWRLSTVGLAVFVSLLGVAIVLQVAGAALIFNYGSQLNAIPISDISVKLNGTSTPSISGKTGLDLEKEAFESFLNITYTECCVHKHWGEGSLEWRHCHLAQELAGSCDQGAHRFKQSLADTLGSFALPLARAYVVFAAWQFFVFVLALCVLWRVASMSKVQYKMGKGFKRIEVK